MARVVIRHELLHYNTSHNEMLRNMALEGVLNPWQNGFRAASNFVQSHYLCEPSRPMKGTGPQLIEYEMGLYGDLCNSIYMELVLPALSASSGDIASWVWGVGYAIIDRVSCVVGKEVLETLDGDYIEMRSELHSKPGKYFTEATFKIDNVTFPELSDLSGKPMTMYVPIPFFFTRGNVPLPLAKMGQCCGSEKVRIRLKTRAVSDIVVKLPKEMGSTANPDLGVTWDDIQVNMWMGVILLNEPERESLLTNDFNEIVKLAEPHHHNSLGTQFRATGDLSIELHAHHPTSQLVWAIADPNRVKTDGRASNSAAPYDSGVRALYGEMASWKFTQNGSQVFLPDWNVRRSGSQTLDTIVYNSDPLAFSLTTTGYFARRSISRRSAVTKAGGRRRFQE